MKQLPKTGLWSWVEWTIGCSHLALLTSPQSSRPSQPSMGVHPWLPLLRHSSPTTPPPSFLNFHVALGDWLRDKSPWPIRHAGQLAAQPDGQSICWAVCLCLLIGYSTQRWMGWAAASGTSFFKRLCAGRRGARWLQSGHSSLPGAPSWWWHSALSLPKWSAMGFTLPRHLH